MGVRTGLIKEHKNSHSCLTSSPNWPILDPATHQQVDMKLSSACLCHLYNICQRCKVTVNECVTSLYLRERERSRDMKDCSDTGGGKKKDKGIPSGFSPYQACIKSHSTSHVLIMIHLCVCSLALSYCQLALRKQRMKGELGEWGGRTALTNLGQG